MKSLKAVADICILINGKLNERRNEQGSIELNKATCDLVSTRTSHIDNLQTDEQMIKTMKEGWNEGMEEGMN